VRDLFATAIRAEQGASIEVPCEVRCIQGWLHQLGESKSRRAEDIGADAMRFVGRKGTHLCVRRIGFSPT
jgi:hypothetical protein